MAGAKSSPVSNAQLSAFAGNLDLRKKKAKAKLPQGINLAEGLKRVKAQAGVAVNPLESIRKLPGGGTVTEKLGG